MTTSMVSDIWQNQFRGLSSKATAWIIDNDIRGTLLESINQFGFKSLQGIWLPVILSGLLALMLLTFATKKAKSLTIATTATDRSEGRPLDLGIVLKYIKSDKDQLKALQEQNAQLRSDLTAAKDMLGTQKVTAAKLNNQQANLQTQNARLEKEANKTRNRLQTEQARSGTLQKQIQRGQMKESQLNQAISAANQRLLSLNAELAKLQVEHEHLRQRYVDKACENELLLGPLIDTDTPFSMGNPDTPGTAPPFVLVLVDGDSYTFNSLHYTQKSVPPGARAAQAIKNEVQQYLLSNPDVAPLQSKIVTRVLQNLTDGLRILRKDGLRQTPDFVLSFTESMPLFDYIDCGRGKERADSKIQENFHLFVSNQSCRCIFLAAARDNGFARMLEQYSSNEHIKSKVVLVHPGYVIPEIAELNYQAVEWPSVFMHMFMPPELRIKMRRTSERKNAEAEQRDLAINKYITKEAFRSLSVEETGFARPRFVTRSSSWRPGLDLETIRDEGLFDEVD